MYKILIGIRNRFFPKGTWRGRIYHLFRLFIYTLKRDGFLLAVREVNHQARADSISGNGQLFGNYWYQNWMLDNEPNQDILAQQEKKVGEFNYRPLISILTPVYNPTPQILGDTIKSVLAQTYPKWELCLVNGGSILDGVEDVLEEYSINDQRIRVKQLPDNLGISNNTNIALEMANGEFVTLLDHDDQFAPNALFEVVSRINEDDSIDFLYSDHDLLTHNGDRREDPLFKPGWSPEIMLSANYVTHLTVIRTVLVKEVGGFDPEFDGAQDWDLFFRITEKTQKIAHIPKVLYHWRKSSKSTADDIWAKDYAPPAQLRTIKAHLKRKGFINPEAFFDSSGFIRVRWDLPEKRKVSIIIPSLGASDLLKDCVDSIINITDYPNYEIIIVNNGAQRPEKFPLYTQIKSDKRIRVEHYEGEFNYSSVNNFGVRYASGDLLLFLNNDTQIIDADWLNELVMWAEREDIGAVGVKLLQKDGRIQHSGVIIGLTGFAGHIFAGLSEHKWSIFGLAEWYRDFTAVTAACVMIRKDLFDQIGGFDETFILCGNDVELCLRIRNLGLRVVYNPFARLIHIEGASRQGDIPNQDFETSYLHYLPILESGDPFFNANLSYWNLSPTFAKPDEPTPIEFVRDFLNAQEASSGKTIE